MRYLVMITALVIVGLTSGCLTNKQAQPNIGIYNHFEQDSKSFVVSGGTQVQAQIRPEKVDKSASESKGSEAEGEADQMITLTNVQDSVKSARETDTSALLSQVTAKQAQAGIQSSEARRDSSASGSKTEANTNDDKDTLKAPIAVTGGGNADSKTDDKPKNAPKQ